jgi:hypothetical protein
MPVYYGQGPRGQVQYGGSDYRPPEGTPAGQGQWQFGKDESVYNLTDPYHQQAMLRPVTKEGPGASMYAAPLENDPMYQAWYNAQTDYVKGYAPAPKTGTNYWSNEETARQLAGGYNPWTGGAALPAAGSGGSNSSGGGGQTNQGVPPGGWQNWFMGLVGGKTPNPGELAALGPELEKWGVRLGNPNAQGINDSIILPDGTVVDVGQSFSSGNDARMGWWWGVDAGNGGGGGAPAAPAFQPLDPNSPLLRGWDQPFAGPSPMPGFEHPGYFAFDERELAKDPGYEFRKKEAEKAFINNAAMRGTTGSGGTLRDFLKYGQEMASQEYGTAYDRAKGEYDTMFNDRVKDYELDKSAWTDSYNRSWEQYLRDQEVFYKNQQNAYDRLYGGANLGLGAI